ncbi:tol-pal system protein YbgF [Motiliproteus coralliicola]|uniref:Cell division coordinator CpoB n=1 Tax=Motiliproteus coralliicola TaxID=2283196 RepID=A0A369WUL9_9GAMM|nr:tol-pal system protein YbgF [Motiliproteus coralliicola]RDE24254.1 tol-pal system protein YbgF [Motiliproteus coralliicola]
MMRSSIAPAALLLAFVPMLPQAADGVPVEDRNGSGPGSAAPAMAQTQAQAQTQTPTAASPTATPASSVSANAQLLMMLEQLQEEVQFLRGQVEQQQHQLRRMQTDQRDRYRDLDRRITRLNQQPAVTPGSSLPPALPSTLPSAGSEPSSLPKASDTATPAGSSPSGVSDAQAYKEAFALVRGNSFDAALGAFERFLQQYPQSSLVANVLYWTGEVHRAKPRPEPQLASEAYQQLVERFPQHSKASDALYKLGLSQQDLGRNEDAKASMQQVVERFPNSASANLAQEFLKQQR